MSTGGLGTAIVVGVGHRNGLGAALARRLAREGLRTVIAGRSEDKLKAVAEDVQYIRRELVYSVTDATSESQVTELFGRAVAQDASLQLVVFNAGANAAMPFPDIRADLFESLWRQSAFGGFLVGREAVRHMLPRARGTIIFTGATASLRARPPFTAFASAKAALRAVAQGMAREFGPQGIHVAHIVIDGVIDGDYAGRNFPDLVRAKGDNGLLDPEAIAGVYWDLHRQDATAWTHELDLRPFKEPF